MSAQSVPSPMVFPSRLISGNRQIDIQRAPDGSVLILVEGDARAVWPRAGMLLASVFLGGTILAIFSQFLPAAASFTLAIIGGIGIGIAVVTAVIAQGARPAVAIITGRRLVIEARPDAMELYVRSPKMNLLLNRWPRENIVGVKCASGAVFLSFRDGSRRRLLLSLDSGLEANCVRLSLLAGLKMCNECNYDLRASSGRCPECGTSIPAWMWPK